MDLSKILAGVKQGLDVIQSLEPLAALGGPSVAGVANIVAGLSKVAEDALANVQTGVIAAGSEDQAELKAILADLQLRSDALDANIRGG